MKTYSVDFRERALALVDGGRTLTEVAALLGVGTATLKRWRRRRAVTGGLAPAAKPGRPPRIGPGERAALEAQVRAAPDATLAEHCAAWEAATAARVSPATMCRALQRIGWRLKKNTSWPASGTRPPGRPGARRPPPSPRRTWSSSTRRAPTSR